jgi:hypothetical protein
MTIVAVRSYIRPTTIHILSLLYVSALENIRLFCGRHMQMDGRYVHFLRVKKRVHGNS